MSEGSGPASGQRSVSPLRRALGLITSVVGAVVVIALVVATVGVIAGWRPSLNPFGVETTDRPGAPVIQSLLDLQEFHAASAHYETVVDLDKDVDNLPDWVSGERILYVGKGDVDAFVDFSELDERRVVLSEDATSVTIRLPAPVAGKPALDLETSYVVEHSTGILNRFEGSALEREAQLKAVTQMSSAASGEAVLIDRAKENTSSMLRGLLGALGYTSITITFDEDAR